eukprot:c19713_g1_i1.p1 GENE.c19713_g1_i1~~c19713_g1_i1.p1  ORF type:complete len:659 (+),score=154.82 c19713_g1_i1:59-1978(+)
MAASQKSAHANVPVPVNMEMSHVADKSVRVAEKSKQYKIAYRDLTLKAVQKNGAERRILDGITGYALPGEMMAVMGPSGSGKTTLLNAVAGRLKSTNKSKFSGDITFNGHSHKDVGFKRIAAYVMQDDAMVGVLTVKENILFSANMRLPFSMSHEEKLARVNHAIEACGLTKVANTRIGTFFLRGISGGERRRTSLAVEMVTRPSIMLLDEPTSGLDSASAYHVVKHLRKTCEQERMCVMMTIHQPSSEVFDLFQKVHLVQSGKTFFFGSRTDLISYMEGIGKPIPLYSNPADFVMSVVNTDFVGNDDSAKAAVAEIIEKFATSPQYKQLQSDAQTHASKVEGDAMPVKPEKNNAFVHLWFLIRRALTVSRRDILVYWIRVAMYVMLALLMGSVWYDVSNSQDTINDRFAAYFFSVAFLCFMAVVGIPAFLEDRRVFARERASGVYSPSAYVISNFLVSIPFVFFVAFMFTVVAYPMMALNKSSKSFGQFLVLLYLALMVAENLAITVAAIIPNFIGSLTVVSFCNGFFMLVQGFFVRKTNIPDFWYYWGHFWSYQKYPFEAMVKWGFEGQEFDCGASCHCVFPTTSNLTCAFTGEDVLREFDYSDVNPEHWIGVLIGMIIGYRILFWVALKYRTPPPL